MTIQPERIESLFNTLKGKRILVVGDVMIDRYLRGSVKRISPEAPVPVVEMESETYHFGGAANVTLNLKTLGCEPITLGLLGRDHNAGIFFDLIEKAGLDGSGFIQASDRPTTIKTRIIGDNQHMVRIDHEQILYGNESLEQELRTQFERLAPNADAIILEDYNKGLLSAEFIRYILEYSNRENKIVTVDPKFRNFLNYQGATVFKPNIIETAQALGWPVEEDTQVEKAGFELLKKLNVKTVMLTRGADGISIFNEGGKSVHLPVKTRKVADVSGAGDTVIAVMTALLSAGASVLEAAVCANHAAGIVCGEVGIVPIQPQALITDLLRNQ